MKVRAVAIASDRSNAIGTVELECTPHGLVVVHLGVGAFSEDYAPAALTSRTSIGMVFYYYPTKDELFLAVVEQVYAKLLASLDELLSSNDPVRDRLAGAFEWLGDTSSEELDVLRLVVREALLSSDRFRAVLERFRTGHVALLLRTLAEGLEKGEIAEGPPLPILLVATMGIGGVPQIIRRVAGKDLPFALPGARELARRSVDMLFEGIAKPKSRPKKQKAISRRSRRP
jgi:AcrR family transcriptional regulator